MGSKKGFCSQSSTDELLKLHLLGSSVFPRSANKVAGVTGYTSPSPTLLFPRALSVLMCHRVEHFIMHIFWTWLYNQQFFILLCWYVFYCLLLQRLKKIPNPNSSVLLATELPPDGHPAYSMLFPAGICQILSSNWAPCHFIKIHKLHLHLPSC